VIFEMVSPTQYW